MGTADRREREKEQRRNDIIDAAEKVFFEKGIETATMDDVAEQVELSKGTLYLYFKSKNDLVLAINARGHSILNRMYQEDIEAASNGLEKLKAILWSYVRFFESYPDYARMSMRFRPFRIEADNRAAADYAGEVDIYFQNYFDAIQEGVRDGSIRSDIDCRVATSIIWGSIIGLMQLHSLEDHEIINKWLDLKTVDIKKYITEALDRLLSG